MQRNSDTIDLYTRLKHDEQEVLQRQALPSSVSKAIPFKFNATKFLVPTIGRMFYTDGFSSMKQDDTFERTLFDEEMEVPSIGTDRKNFDTAEMITFDINGESTFLPLMCKTIIQNQGATNEREPPALLRDACIQWDGIDPPRRNNFNYMSLNKTNRSDNNLERARSTDDLLGGTMKSVIERTLNDMNRCSSMESSLIEDVSSSSLTMSGDQMQYRASRLLRRHKYQSQIDTNFLGVYEYYSVPFYQYRGRRYGPNDIEIQVNESDINTSSNSVDNRNPTAYSVTLILPVRDRKDTANSYLNNSKGININIPTNSKSKHTTIGYVNAKEFVTIQRTIRGQAING